MVCVGGGAPATTTRTVPVGGGVEHCGDDRRSTAQQRHPVLLDATEDLGAVDLAEDDVLPAHGGHDVGHAPAIAVEHRERVEVDVAVAHEGVPAEDGGVEPQVPVGHLDALGACGGAARVVDRGGRTLVGGPWAGFDAFDEQAVRLLAGDQAPAHLHVSERRHQLRVHEEHLCTRVVDDVLDLFGVEAEVDRHADAPVGTGAEQEYEHPCGVVRHDRHPCAEVEAKAVEPGGHGPGQFGHATVGEVGEWWGHLVGFVDHGDAVAVDELGAP
jgi:hypothetical protein